MLRLCHECPAECEKCRSCILMRVAVWAGPGLCACQPARRCQAAQPRRALRAYLWGPACPSAEFLERRVQEMIDQAHRERDEKAPELPLIRLRV